MKLFCSLYTKWSLKHLLTFRAWKLGWASCRRELQSSGLLSLHLNIRWCASLETSSLRSRLHLERQSTISWCSSFHVLASINLLPTVLQDIRLKFHSWARVLLFPLGWAADLHCLEEKFCDRSDDDFPLSGPSSFGALVLKSPLQAARTTGFAG